MKESRLRKLVRQEIVNKLDKVTEGEDPFVPTYGKGDVVHDCPKHVQEIKTGKKGKVTGHTLNEAGDVNFVDVDFGTGKIFENIPTKKFTLMKYAKSNYGNFDTGFDPETFNDFYHWRKNKSLVIYSRTINKDNIWDEEIYITNDQYEEAINLALSGEIEIKNSNE